MILAEHSKHVDYLELLLIVILDAFYLMLYFNDFVLVFFIYRFSWLNSQI